MSHNNEGIKDLTTANFDQVMSENKVVLVDFWADWCMPCRIQGKMIEGNMERIPQEVLVGKVNVDQHPSIARRFNVRGIPQMYLIVKGEPKKGWTGVTPMDELISEMKRYL
ncbi:MAG: thioredoxin family protein [Thermoplasmatota archaeon]